MKNSNYRYFVEAKDNVKNEKFLNYNGLPNYADDFAGFDDEMLNADASPAEKAATSQPYIINIENTSTADVSSVKVLGANQNLISVDNYGNPATIDITMGMSDVTYADFLFQTQSQPFAVGLTWLSSSNTSQILETFILQHKDANGNLTRKTIVPLYDPYQQITTVIPVKQLYSVDGQTMFTFNQILANATLKVYLFPTSKINIRRGLANMPVEQPFSNPGLIKEQKVTLSAGALAALKG